MQIIAETGWPVVLFCLTAVTTGAALQRIAGQGFGLVSTPLIALVQPEMLPSAVLLLGFVSGLGSAALDLAWVAAGRFDGFWESHLKPWDIAAGMVLVREAGGVCSELHGKGNVLETGSILAGNPDLHPVLEKRLRQAGVRAPNVD